MPEYILQARLASLHLGAKSCKVSCPHIRMSMRSTCTCGCSLLALLASRSLLVLVKQEGGGALATVHAVKVVSHKRSRTAVGALLAQALHLARVLNL
eukprot:356197-Chlamydomonas_euryale.AAC.3